MMRVTLFIGRERMQWLKEAAEIYPDKIAIEFYGEILTYHELYNKALQMANNLIALNQTRIALQAENTLSDCVIIHGAIVAGIEIVMINKHLTAQEITRQMASVNTKLLITNHEFDAIQTIKKSELLNLNESLDSPVMNQPNDILSIMFTSGTTGVQKAVPQRFINHYASNENCKRIFCYDADAIWLDVLPLFHISGLSILLRAVMEGCTVVLHEKFDAQQILEDIEKKTITHTSLVPQTLERLLRHGLTHRFSLQGILIGGAKLDDRVLAETRRLNLPIYTSFGMTETCSQMITANQEDIELHPRSVGRINDNIQLFNVQNGVGEIGVRGDNVMHGYLYPTAANTDAFSGQYFLTGDIGYIEEDYLYILDRRKDLIISGGENIYPSEVEQVILNHTDVHAACIIGIDDDTWGNVPVCLYEADGDKSDQINLALINYLAKYKHPKQLVLVDNLKRTSNGKISRHQCKEWFINENDKA
ncbi:o-succinylbenzoate--CoA ligase [Macrococcus equi]|uniref:o-succinylbenzoate--CoA ligase n=2 Tax=Macrococcus equi TaxID=3395462 RepID=UPI0039BE8656